MRKKNLQEKMKVCEPSSSLIRKLSSTLQLKNNIPKYLEFKLDSASTEFISS